MNNKILLSTILFSYVFTNLICDENKPVEVKVVEQPKKKTMTLEEKNKCIECWDTHVCGNQCKDVCPGCPDVRTLENWHVFAT